MLAWIENHLALLWLISAGLLIILLLWLVMMQARVSRLLGRYLELMRGREGRPLEEILDEYLQQARVTAEQVEQLTRASRQLEKAAKLSLQHLGIVRFDAYPDVSGQQSFSIALVDGHGNGVVLTSLAGRQSQRVYAKPLRGWESEHNLTDEEKEAIARAFLQRH